MTPALPHAGDTVSGHRLLRRLGGGSRSEVWQADGPQGLVALKLARDAHDRPRLRKEALLLGELDHPGVVQLVDAAPDGDWLAMVWVEGCSAEQWAAGASLGAQREAIAALAEALGVFHDQGVFHGDIKPSNVMVRPDGHPVLLDLGLAAEPPVDTRAGFHGSFGHAAPEQLAGGAPTAATDVHGLGLLAWRMLFGAPAFGHSAGPTSAWQPSHAVPLPPRLLRSDLPPALGDLLLDMVAPAPTLRPTTAAVAQVMRSTPDRPRPSPTLPDTLRALVPLLQTALSGTPTIASLWGDRPDWRELEHMRRELQDWTRRTGHPLPVTLSKDPSPDPAVGLHLHVSDHRRPDLVAAGAVELALDGGHLPTDLRQALAQGPLDIRGLAQRLGSTTLDVLDRIEPFLDSGRLHETDGQITLHAPSPGAVP